MGTEADICRTLITPKLQAAGWDTCNFAYPAFVSPAESDEYGRTTSVAVETTEENKDNAGVLAENSLVLG